MLALLIELAITLLSSSIISLLISRILKKNFVGAQKPEPNIEAGNIDNNKNMEHVAIGNDGVNVIEKDSDPIPPFNPNSIRTRARHAKQVKADEIQQREDGDLKNFKKSGTIFIPHAVHSYDFKKSCQDPDNIQLDTVKYDPSGNEVFDIGSEIDNIELNPSTVDTSQVSTDNSTKTNKNPKKTKPHKSG